MSKFAEYIIFHGLIWDISSFETSVAINEKDLKQLSYPSWLSRNQYKGRFSSIVFLDIKVVWKATDTGEVLRPGSFVGCISIYYNIQWYWIFTFILWLNISKPWKFYNDFIQLFMIFHFQIVWLDSQILFYTTLRIIYLYMS